MLVDYVLESQNAGLFESVLFPLDIYNDSAQHALVTLKQCFLYDEIEAEVFSLIIQYLSFDSSDLPQRNSLSYIMSIPIFQAYVAPLDLCMVKRNSRKGNLINMESINRRVYIKKRDKFRRVEGMDPKETGFVDELCILIFCLAFLRIQTFFGLML